MFKFRFLQAIAVQRLPRIKKENILLHGRVLKLVLLQATTVTMVTMYAKNGIHKLTAILQHKLSQEKYCLLRRNVLQCTVFRGYHEFNNKTCYCIVQLPLVTIGYQ